MEDTAVYKLSGGSGQIRSRKEEAGVEVGGCGREQRIHLELSGAGESGAAKRSTLVLVDFCTVRAAKPPNFMARLRLEEIQTPI
jgi:hypothetical protein